MEEDKRPQNFNTEKGLREEDYYDMDAITARIAARKREKAERNRRARRRFYIILGLAVVFIGLLIFSFSSFFDVDSIEVEGNSYFTAEEVINISHATPGQNLIYKPEKKMIVEYLEKDPYIKKATVKRHFPSTLIIQVEERKPLCSIKYDDEFLIIDKEGILLRKTKTQPKNTLVEGQVVKKIELGETIGVEDKELLDQTIKILTTMKEKDLYFVNLDMSDMYIKAYVYDTLLCKGTYKQMISAMEEDKLHKVLEKLFEDNISRGTITFSDEGYASFIPTL